MKSERDCCINVGSKAGDDWCCGGSAVLERGGVICTDAAVGATAAAAVKDGLGLYKRVEVDSGDGGGRTREGADTRTVAREGCGSDRGAGDTEAGVADLLAFSERVTLPNLPLSKCAALASSS